MCLSKNVKKIIIYRDYSNDDVHYYKAQCTCGHKFEGNYNNRNEIPDICPDCGCNEQVAFSNWNVRFLDPYIEVIKTTEKGFKLKRINVSYFFDKDNELKVKENMERIITVDLINKTVELLKNGKIDDKYTYNSEKLEIFFRGLSDYKIIEKIEFDKKTNFYNHIYQNLGRRDTWGYSYNKYISTALYKYLFKYTKYDYLQILASAGYSNVGRFVNKYNSDNRINETGKSPKEILRIPKNTPKKVINYIRDNDISLDSIEKLFNFIRVIDENTLISCLKIAEEESNIGEFIACIDDIIALYENYGYKNIKKLTVYLLRDVHMLQGITRGSNASNLLFDYNRMSYALHHTPEKFTRNLKKEHDISSMNYRMYKNEVKHEEFYNTIHSDGYARHLAKYKDYSIIAPKDIDDLIREGDELSHCIASYTDRIITGKSKIYFLRKNDNLEKSLVSIEVVNFSIRQARGFANRTVTDDEKEIIKKWAEENRFIEDYY